jgi:hypothetical protein
MAKIHVVDVLRRKIVIVSTSTGHTYVGEVRDVSDKWISLDHARVVLDDESAEIEDKIELMTRVAMTGLVPPIVLSTVPKVRLGVPYAVVHFVMYCDASIWAPLLGLSEMPEE